MKKTTIKDIQTLNKIKEYESDRNVNGICRKYGVFRVSFYNQKKKYSGMDGFHVKRLKDLEEENQYLKRMDAD